VPKANGDEAKSSKYRLQRICRKGLQLRRMLLGANDNSCSNHNHTLPHNSATHARKHLVPKANGDEAESSEDHLRWNGRQGLQRCGMLLDANYNASPNNHTLPDNHTLPNNHTFANNQAIHLQELLLPS